MRIYYNVKPKVNVDDDFMSFQTFDTASHW